MGARKHLGFYPKVGGSTGGLWAEEAWDLTWVLMDALWWLLREDRSWGHQEGRD